MRCEICEHIVSTDSWKSTTTQQTYFIKLENLKCSSENVVYLFICKTCSKQYIGLITKDVHTKPSSKVKKLNKTHLKLILQRLTIMVRMTGKWSLKFENEIDQTNNVEEPGKRESFWQHELDTFQPNGLNEREVALFWYLKLSSFFCNFDPRYLF